MIELKGDQLVFRFSDVHEDAVLRVEFQRTFRIPDDGKNYPLPPGFGRFPLRHVDDFAARVPNGWMEHGGVMLPMYQSEAMWLRFDSSYPFAIKVATGKIDAVTGEMLRPGLGRKPQNYLVAPEQPWLDGYCVEKGVIRQFVAMPLGAGYTAEEQITGAAEHGGLQLMVYPMKAEAYEALKRQPVVKYSYSPMASVKLTGTGYLTAEMGLAPGGRMKQEIFRDKHNLDDWDTGTMGRCFVHLANSMAWRQITDQAPPTVPPTAKEYQRAGLPWFEYYAAGETAVGGSGILNKLKSVAQLAKRKGDQVREGTF